MKCTLSISVLVPFFAVLSHSLASNNPDEYNDTPLRDSEEILIPGKTLLVSILNTFSPPAAMSKKKIYIYATPYTPPSPRMTVFLFQRERLEDVNTPRIKYLAKLAVDKIDHYGISVPDPLPRVVTKVFHAVTRVR